MSRKEGFLDRWSRLKETGEPPEAEAPLVEAEKPEEPEVDERSDEEILVELGLPDPDDLTLGDDVTGFMSKAVPDRLRRRALRQLWRTNPVLANVDGLVEYGEDYTDSAMVVENMQTLYQVGKGMFVEPEEPEEVEEDENDAEEQPEEMAEADEDEDSSEITDLTADLSDESDAEVEESPLPEVAEIEDTSSQPTLRRMTFS